MRRILKEKAIIYQHTPNNSNIIFMTKKIQRFESYLAEFDSENTI